MPKAVISRRQAFLLAIPAYAQQAQNPSPMVEHTRPHPRLQQPPSELPGIHEPLIAGRLFVPAAIAKRKSVPLFVHFHGAAWVANLAAVQNRWAVIAVETGSGSGVYAKQFEDRALFARMLAEAQEKAHLAFEPVALTCWSAGHGAIREILANPDDYARVRKVLLIDGMHTGYAPDHSLEPDHLEVFRKFARDAVAGRKTMLIVHSEIFPGTFASTTETADWLLNALGLRRTPVLKRGPMGTQQLGEVRAGKFTLLAYAGNSAPDHVDEFHSLPVFLKSLK